MYLATSLNSTRSITGSTTNITPIGNNYTYNDLVVGDIVVQSYYSTSYPYLYIGVVTAKSSNTLTIKTVFISGGKFTCLEQNTLITMADGSTKPIKDVKEGDLILSYDFDKKQNVPAVAILSEVAVNDSHSYYLFFDNKTKIQINWTHDIYNKTKNT